MYGRSRWIRQVSSDEGPLGHCVFIIIKVLQLLLRVYALLFLLTVGAEREM